MDPLTVVPQEQLRELLDKQDLVERKHAYLRAADVCDPERMVAGFAEDFTASYLPGEPPMVGRQTIRDWYARRLTDIVGSSHHASNFEFALDGDRATTHCYLYSWQRFSDHPQTQDRHLFARYTDTWERRDGAWVQTSLVYRIAAEFCDAAAPRFGEHLEWDRAALG